MNESDTRLKKINVQLRNAGWEVVPDSHIYTEQNVAPGRIVKGKKQHPEKMDYLLVYRGVKLGIIEAKADTLPVIAGVEQAKKYADAMKIRFTYASNGNEIYQIDMEKGEQGKVKGFPSPLELWNMTFPKKNTWRDKFNLCRMNLDDRHNARYYQEIAIRKVTDAIANKQNRILLTMATGTGKTFTAFQICWKLMETRWNIDFDESRKPRILFLSDRNILSDQALLDFDGFEPSAMCRITPDEIRKSGLPYGKSLYFTIFQTFMTTDDKDQPYYTHYPKNFFDFIIIDECHRGGANDESQWRGIMEYFSDAYQLGLTATPRRDVNVDTYNYFGEPVYTYSLKQGIADGYLTPFRVVRVTSDLDEYQYDPTDDVESGEVDPDRVYTESDFATGKIKIDERDRLRVERLFELINKNEKTIVFCSTQMHAAEICELINEQAHVPGGFYCKRVTADDGKEGEDQLKLFQDNERTIPTILTTSRKLSTGVDARNVRNIVLFRPVNNMVEFKQILGRGTRLFDDKYYFTLYDFVRASDRFEDEDWDGIPDPIERPETPTNDDGGDKGNDDNDEPTGPYTPPVCPICGMSPCVCEANSTKLKIRLSDDHIVEVKKSQTAEELFLFGDELIDMAEYVRRLFGCIPKFFKSSDDLRKQWSDPNTRQELINQLEAENFSMDRLNVVREMLSMEDCDMMDVLEFLAYQTTPLERQRRIEIARDAIMHDLTESQKDYVNFVLKQYVQEGYEVFDNRNMGKLVVMKYGTVRDGVTKLGINADEIRNLNLNIQRQVYYATA